MHIKQLFSQVRKTIKEYQMINKGDKVLIGVSGGADSVFLLYALEYLKKEFLIDLYVVNIDHGLRGEESAAETLFVKALCKEKGIKCFTKKVAIKKHKELSTEEVARKQRYTVFKATAKKLNVKKVATAHNLNDQAETVLMRVIKGTALKGLAGIPPLRQEKDLTYIRPLIDVAKNDIRNMLRSNKIKFKVDSSNKDEKFFRNTVRKKVLPYLKKYNPKIVTALCKMAESLREDKIFIEKKKDSIKEYIKDNKKQNCKTISLSRLFLQPKAIQKEIIRDMLEDAGANMKKISFTHWKQIRTLVANAQTGKMLQLPGKIIVSKTKKDLIIHR